MKRSYPHIHILLTALTAAALLTGCGLWPWAQHDSQRYCNSWGIETLYGNSTDSVYIETAAVYPSPNAPITIRIDFGDDTHSTVSGQSPFQRIPHLYNANGTYRAIYTGWYKGKPLCSDTVVVVIQDYVRPTLANKIRVKLTGVTMHTARFIDRPGLPDSVVLSEMDNLILDVRPNPEHEDLDCIKWQNIFKLPSQGSCIFEPAPCPELGVYEGIRLSIDGDSLLSMDMFTPSRSPGGNTRIDTTYRVLVYHIPLDRTITPSRIRAVYSMPLNREKEVYLTRTVTNVFDGRKEIVERSIHFSIYPEARITVEFYR